MKALPEETPVTLPLTAASEITSSLAAAEVTGGLLVHNGRAFIASSAVITSGDRTTHVTLPYRGTLSVCASTTVKLAADSSVARVSRLAAGMTPQSSAEVYFK